MTKYTYTFSDGQKYTRYSKKDVNSVKLSPGSMKKAEVVRIELENVEYE